MIVVTVARRPLGLPTVAQNVLLHGVGAVHIDGTRIGTTEALQGGSGGLLSNVRDEKEWGHHAGADDNGFRQSPLGRWPANVILQHLAGCVNMGTTKDGLETVTTWDCEPGCPVVDMDKQSGIQKSGVAVNRNRPGGTMTSWLGTRASQVGADVGFGDVGGASRFFKQVRS